MSYDRRSSLVAVFRGARFAVTQTLRGKRPSRIVWLLANNDLSASLNLKQFAYLQRAVDVPQLPGASYHTACYALQTLSAALAAQPQRLTTAFNVAAPQLLERALGWLGHADEIYRYAATSFLERALPLVREPLPPAVLQGVNRWLNSLPPDDPRRAFQQSLPRPSPPAQQPQCQ